MRGDHGDLVVRGVLADDAGAPLSDGVLTVTVALAASANAPVTLASPPGACTADGRAPRAFTDGVHISADAGGRFCVRLPLPLDRYVVHLGYAGGGFIDGGSVDVAVDLSKQTCALAFAPVATSPRVVPLDATMVTIDATATLEGAEGSAAASGLPLTLWSDKGTSPIARATSDVTGHARMMVAPATLGPPGRGELRLDFAGNRDVAAATRTAPIERRAEVVLDVPDAKGGKLSPASPEDGIPLTVTARAAGQPADGGSVQARVGDAVVGAAPVEAGLAKIRITFGLPEASGPSGDVPISLRYLPSAPWYQANGESTWLLPVQARSPLRQVWVFLGALAVAAWFVLGRVPRPKSAAKPPPKPRTQVRGEAKLDLVRVARNPADGWKGHLTDADDGTGIGGGRVQIERPAFGRAEILATALTGEDGRFELPAVESRPGDELAFEAPLHVPLRRTLPQAGELDAQLVLRKRALLGRLVVWAKLRGRPFDARPEPTPGHVRRAAGDDFRIARWADAVERAAFAGEPVDARVESEIDRLAPSATGPAPEPRPVHERRALAHPTKPNR